MPESDYLMRRQAVLRSFLDRDVIFKTPALHQALEAEARDNPARKVAELQARTDARQA